MTPIPATPAPPPDLGLAGSVRLVKVGKTYGRHRALIDVSLAFRPGRVAAVLGPNGAGKSTLLGILSTLVPPNQGDVLWGSERLARSSLLRARIGYVGHDPGVYADLTATENLTLFCGLYGLPDAADRTRGLLARVGLSEVRADAAVRTFSRGMQQRLSLARALLAEPDLLLFDEPASALDPAGAAWLSEEIDRERQSGRIVVLVTHDLDAAAAVAQHVAVLRRGRLVHEREMQIPMSGAEMRALYQESTRA